MKPKPAKLKTRPPSPKQRERRAAWLSEMEKLPGVFVPIRTSTPGNGLKHWRLQGPINKKQREAVRLALAIHAWTPAVPVQFGEGLRIQYTRYSPSEVDRFGNLPSCFKHCHDTVCAFYGVDDRDKRWDIPEPIQVKTSSGCFGVRILISERKA